MDEKELEQYFESRPGWIKSNETNRESPRGVLSVDGKAFPYTVCKREMQSSIQYFVGYPSQQHLFISDEVPKPDREYYLKHEIREFTDPELKDKEGRCFESLIRELEQVTDEIKASGYISRRTKMYEDLFLYFDGLVKNNQTNTPEQVKGFELMRNEVSKSLDYLRSLNKEE